MDAIHRADRLPATVRPNTVRRAGRGRERAGRGFEDALAGTSAEDEGEGEDLAQEASARAHEGSELPMLPGRSPGDVGSRLDVTG